MKRRSVLQGFVQGVGALALLSPRMARAESARLTIDRLEVFQVRVNRRGNWVIPRLSTASGLTGLGDASQSLNDARCLEYLKQFAALLKGRPALDVEWFRTAVAPIVAKTGAYGRTPAAVAASALEQCLWDIQGKALSLPAYDLMGGRIQPRIRLYANINRSTDPRTPDGFAAMAGHAVTAGFDAFKLAPFDDMPRGLHVLPDGGESRVRFGQAMEAGIACARAVRQAIGPQRDLLVDAHSHFTRPEGMDLMARMRPLDLYWLEEVTAAQGLEDLAAIARAAPMPTAGGEAVQGVEGFYPYIKAGAADIVMPDVKVCGGMWEMKKIAALAQGAGLLCSPHGPASPIGNVAAAHVVATIPNFNILEFSFGEVPWRAELTDPPEQIDKGALTLSGRPGLGLALNEKIVARYAVSP
jgi:galactonate dehydratase